MIYCNLHRIDYLAGGSQFTSQTSQSSEYQEFRSRFPLKRVAVDEDASKEWMVYDSGPRQVTCPVLFFPPVAGTAELFFKQVVDLSQRGYRVISISYPVYWTLREYVNGFVRLLDHLKLDKVHVFGASVGGFIAQKIAEYISNCQRIQSLILCNSFSDTSAFYQTERANLFWIMPGRLLKRTIIRGSTLRDSFATGSPEIADSMVFVSESLHRMSQAELASRLTVSCTSSYVEPQRLQSIPVTIIDVFDRHTAVQKARDILMKMYPDARWAHLKTGGNFPFLSEAEEVNLHIMIHLREFTSTRYSAQSSPSSLLPHHIKPMTPSTPTDLDSDVVEADENLA